MGYKKSATKKNKEKKATRRPIIRVATGQPHAGYRPDPASMRLAEGVLRVGSSAHLNVGDGMLMGFVEEEEARGKVKNKTKNK